MLYLVRAAMCGYLNRPIGPLMTVPLRSEMAFQNNLYPYFRDKA